MICATIRWRVATPPSVSDMNRFHVGAGARLTETAVLKSAGLESLLKSKNSIGDRNPLKRVSCNDKGKPDRQPKSSSLRNGDQFDAQSHHNTGTLWCGSRRESHAHEVFGRVRERDIIE